MVTALFLHLFYRNVRPRDGKGLAQDQQQVSQDLGPVLLFQRLSSCLFILCIPILRHRGGVSYAQVPQHGTSLEPSDVRRLGGEGWGRPQVTTVTASPGLECEMFPSLRFLKRCPVLPKVRARSRFLCPFPGRLGFQVQLAEVGRSLLAKEDQSLESLGKLGA